MSKINQIFCLFKSAVVVLVVVIFIAMPALAASVEDMVKNADNYRLEAASAKVVSLVKSYKNNELDTTRRYHVYTRPNRESLVVFKSQVEAGQKMLMLGDNYWLLMPKSRRPIRITPMQKLLGEASVGDISTLTWSDDYSAELVAQEEVIETKQGSVEANKLELTAKTTGASYQRIELWLSRGNDFPIQANLYLRSGKLAKQAWFVEGKREGVTRVVAMELLDQIQPSKKTIIDYEEVSLTELDEKYYNPAYLTRQSDLGL